MGRWRIGRQIRALRRRRGWCQADLGARLDASRELISRIENDRLDNVPAGKIQSCVEQLGGYLRLDVLWQGERLPRLLDARHAALQNGFTGVLERSGWLPRPEVSFNHYGDRGRIDILAYHPATGTLLVVEIKAEIADAQDTLGRLDIKVRVAPRLAAGAGWAVSGVVPVLTVRDGSTPRRHVAQHAALFRRFELRGRAALTWIRRPAGRPAGILVFLAESAESAEFTSQRRGTPSLAAAAPW